MGLTSVNPTKLINSSHIYVHESKNFKLNVADIEILICPGYSRAILYAGQILINTNGDGYYEYLCLSGTTLLGLGL